MQTQNETPPDQTGQAQDTATQIAADIAPGAADAAVVLPAQAQADQADEHEGKGGGLYVLKDGKRVLVERTQLEPDTSA